MISKFYIQNAAYNLQVIREYEKPILDSFCGVVLSDKRVFLWLNLSEYTDVELKELKDLINAAKSRCEDF